MSRVFSAFAGPAFTPLSAKYTTKLKHLNNAHNNSTWVYFTSQLKIRAEFNAVSVKFIPKLLEQYHTIS